MHILTSNLLYAPCKTSMPTRHTGLLLAAALCAPRFAAIAQGPGESSWTLVHWPGHARSPSPRRPTGVPVAKVQSELGGGGRSGGVAAPGRPAKRPRAHWHLLLSLQDAQPESRSTSAILDASGQLLSFNLIQVRVQFRSDRGWQLAASDLLVASSESRSTWILVSSSS